MKKIILLIIFLYLTPTRAQTYSAITSDEEIYSFLNWVSNEDALNSQKKRHKRKKKKLKSINISYAITKWDSINFIPDPKILIIFQQKYLFQKEIDSLFNQADKDFIFKQFTGIKDSIWHKSFSNTKLLKTTNTDFPIEYTTYSIPLFSIDKNHVIINKNYICDKNLCSGGASYIYRRIGENKWEFVTKVNIWFS